MSLGEPLGQWTEVAVRDRRLPFLPVIPRESFIRVPDRLRLLAGMLKFADEVVASGADAYYVHMTEAAIGPILTSCKPVIVHVHGLYNLFEYSRYPFGRIYARIYEKFYPALFCRCAKVIGVGSRREFEDFSRTMKVASGAAIPTCVRTDIFYPRDRSQARKRLGMKAEDKLLLFVGRMTATKNPQLLLQCVRRLRPEFPCLKAAFVGDGPERQKLADEAQSLGGISVLGQLSPDHIAIWMSAADILTVVSKTEAFTSIAALEALSCGTPVVATPVSALPEMVREGVNGAVSDEMSVNAYCNALRRVLMSPPASPLCTASVRDFTPEAVSGQIIEQIHAALSEKHRPSLPFQISPSAGTLSPTC